MGEAYNWVVSICLKSDEWIDQDVFLSFQTFVEQITYKLINL